MAPVNYFAIIHKYIPPESPVYQVYLPHVALVTAKALKIAKRLGLSYERRVFIEEAAMLHDIGIVMVKRYSSSDDCTLPYLCHAPAGREILEREGLPFHALVAERHIGVGITRKEILNNQYPLPPRDLIPKTIEERIISYADLFFSKTPDKLWIENSIEDVEKRVGRYGKKKVKIFRAWVELFREG